MSLWSDDPEYFEEWIEKRAMEGELGHEIQSLVEQGEILGSELWNKVLNGEIPDRDFARRAEVWYVERFIE